MIKKLTLNPEAGGVGGVGDGLTGGVGGGLTGGVGAGMVCIICILSMNIII